VFWKHRALSRPHARFAPEGTISRRAHACHVLFLLVLSVRSLPPPLPARNVILAIMFMLANVSFVTNNVLVVVQKNFVRVVLLDILCS
jgi:hypothetical protein